MIWKGTDGQVLKDSFLWVSWIFSVLQFLTNKLPYLGFYSKVLCHIRYMVLRLGLSLISAQPKLFLQSKSFVSYNKVSLWALIMDLENWEMEQDKKVNLYSWLVPVSLPHWNPTAALLSNINFLICSGAREWIAPLETARGNPVLMWLSLDSAMGHWHNSDWREGSPSIKAKCCLRQLTLRKHIPAQSSTLTSQGLEQSQRFSK